MATELTPCALCHHETPKHDLVMSEHGEICAQCEIDPPGGKGGRMAQLFKRPEVFSAVGMVVAQRAISLTINGRDMIGLATGGLGVVLGGYVIATAFKPHNAQDKQPLAGIGAVVIALSLWKIVSSL